jgi:signal transduction histidine kinase
MRRACAARDVGAIGNDPEIDPDASRRLGRDHRLVTIVRSRLSRAGFTRPVEGRLVAGVARGIADALGLDPNVVRCGFVVLSLASGLGVVCYAVAWLLMPERDSGAVTRAPRVDDPVATFAFGAVVLGGLLLARAIGWWPGDVIVWPLAVVIVGLALLAVRTSEVDGASDLPPWPVLQRLPPDAADALAALIGTRRGALARAVAGGICVALGVTVFVVSVDSWRALRGALAAMFVVFVGIGLVIGPALTRLLHALVDERRERIRADERAEVAAHLHDSVLQTLALVQRRADDPREVVRLARAQERELRGWLLGGGGPGTESGAAAESLGGALEELAAAIDAERGVPVDVVRVRDCPIDGLEPLLLAAREAIVNAAQHSGAPGISVYLEVDSERATIFVRDRGRGFDRAGVPADRGGITNSIIGRMARAGGRADVRSTPGDGTEVELALTRPKQAERAQA